MLEEKKTINNNEGTIRMSTQCIDDVTYCILHAVIEDDNESINRFYLVLNFVQKTSFSFIYAAN